MKELPRKREMSFALIVLISIAIFLGACFLLLVYSDYRDRSNLMRQTVAPLEEFRLTGPTQERVDAALGMPNEVHRSTETWKASVYYGMASDEIRQKASTYPKVAIYGGMMVRFIFFNNDGQMVDFGVVETGLVD